MADSDMGRLIELLDSPWLIELRQAADRDVLMRADLASMQLPGDVRPDDAWKVLTAIRHQTASVLPFEPYVGTGNTKRTWYTVPKALARNLKEIDIICSRGSATDTAFGSLVSTYPVLGLLEDELAFALEVECVPVDRQRIHAVFTGAVTEPKGIDRIIKNFHGLIFNTGEFAKRDITPGLIEELYWRLVAGAEDFAIPDTKKREWYRPDPQSPYHDPRACRSLICLFADNTKIELYHPIFQLICISWFLWDFNAAPNLNTVVEILLRHILTARWGCPVLGWLPFNRNDQYVGTRVYQDSIADCGYGLDCTFLFYKIVEYLLGGAHDLANITQKARELSDRIDTDLKGRLNSRQRAIVANAILSPETALRIEPHRQRYGVTYPTARADFQQLVDMGYLVRGQEGRAFVFRADKSLREFNLSTPDTLA